MSTADGRFDFDFDFDLFEGTRWVVAVLYLFLTTSPIFYSFTIAFRNRGGLRGPVHLVPNPITFKWWMAFIEAAGRYLVNTVLVAVGASIIIVALAIPAGYAFGRLEFPGRTTLFYTVIGITLVPEIMLVVPMGEIIRNLGLYDTIVGQWIAILTSGMVLSVWMLRDNFQKLPANAEEAARVYGCTKFSAFVRVVLPLAVPVIIAAFFFAFVRTWTEFFFTSFLTTNGGPQPAIVYLFHQLGPDVVTNWPFLMAGSFLIGLPPAILYLFTRRYLNEAIDF